MRTIRELPSGALLKPASFPPSLPAEHAVQGFGHLAGKPDTALRRVFGRAGRRTGKCSAPTEISRRRSSRPAPLLYATQVLAQLPDYEERE
jgi:hypothetical protein